MKRRAFSLVEAMVAIAIIAVAFIPIVGMFSQENQVAHFTEYHLIARCRAGELLDALSARGYEQVKKLAGSGTLVPMNDIANFPPPGDVLPSVLPTFELQALSLTHEPSLPNTWKRRKSTEALFRENVLFEQLHANGLGRLVAVISWKVPNERSSARPHFIRVVRYISCQDNSQRKRPMLKGKS